MVLIVICRCSKMKVSSYLTVVGIVFATYLSLIDPSVDGWWAKSTSGKICITPCIFFRLGDFYLDGQWISDGKNLKASCATTFSTKQNHFETCDPFNLVFEGELIGGNSRYCISKCYQGSLLSSPWCYTYDTGEAPKEELLLLKMNTTDGISNTTSNTQPNNSSEIDHHIDSKNGNSKSWNYGKCDPNEAISYYEQQYLTIYGFYCTGLMIVFSYAYIQPSYS